MKIQAFEVLLLAARPAAGKSEIIHYLKYLEPQERLQRFHILPFEEIDDFPMLWTWFEEDDLLEKMGYPRLHTDREGYFTGNHLWNLLVERICLEYQKRLRDQPDYHQHHTTIIEFARGSEHGGFTSAFAHLGPQVIEKLAVVYIQVSWEESLRKNRKRFNPQRPDSILQHSLPDKKMERLYKESDWEAVSAADPDYLLIQGAKVPYAVLENEDDVTTRGGEELGRRLESTLNLLWQRKQQLHP